MIGRGALWRAIATVHADQSWLPKLLLHGLLGISVFGTPLALGWVMESIDNSRKGFATPLPPWMDWTTRYLLGVFVLLIDFSFFVLPLLVIGMLSLCLSVATLSGAGTNGALLGALFTGAGLLGGLLFAAAFFSSASPVGRLVYADDGRIEQALSVNILRRALRPPDRNVFFRARLVSLPAYLPALLLGALTFQFGQLSFAGQGVVLLLLLWLTSCALVYAHLVVAQIYVAAEREVQRRIMALHTSG